MSIDWMEVPSMYQYAHQSSADPLNVVFTNCPMLEKDGRLFYPYNELVSCHVRQVCTFPEGELQISRPSLSKPLWELLPNDVEAIELYNQGDCDLILKRGVDVRQDHIDAGEIVKRMNLKPGVYWCRPKVGDGKCIKAAIEVMREQRIKGIEKYNTTIEANDTYDVMDMLRMAQEEMADGAVYLAKLKMMLDRLRDHAARDDLDAIKKELGL